MPQIDAPPVENFWLRHRCLTCSLRGRTLQIMESLEAHGYRVLSQLSKGQYSSVLAAYSSVHQSKVAVKLLPPTDVQCSLIRNAALSAADWIVDLPSEVSAVTAEPRIDVAETVVTIRSPFCGYNLA